jgi:hypothetical protein
MLSMPPPSPRGRKTSSSSRSCDRWWSFEQLKSATAAACCLDCADWWCAVPEKELVPPRLPFSSEATPRTASASENLGRASSSATAAAQAATTTTPPLFRRSTCRSPPPCSPQARPQKEHTCDCEKGITVSRGGVVCSGQKFRKIRSTKVAVAVGTLVYGWELRNDSNRRHTYAYAGTFSPTATRRDAATAASKRDFCFTVTVITVTVSTRPSHEPTLHFNSASDCTAADHCRSIRGSAVRRLAVTYGT